MYLFTSTANNGELLLAKWLSVMEHVTNTHDGFEDPLFPQCAHAPIETPKEWILHG